MAPSPVQKLFLFGLFAIVSCSSSVPNNALYKDSQCYACASAQCAAVVSRCSAEPGCALYWECVKQCPVGELGDADPGCESRCPLGQTSSDEQTRYDLHRCRDLDQGASCADCGKLLPETSLPETLRQQCPAPAQSDSVCGKCLYGHCCYSVLDSLRNPEADLYFDCAGACEEGPDLYRCRYACLLRYPAATRSLAGEAACTLHYCLQPGVCYEEGPRDDALGIKCLRCVGDKCPREAAAYQSEPDCFRFDACIRASDCRDPRKCLETCEKAHPRCVPLIDPYLTCKTNVCQPECS